MTLVRFVGLEYLLQAIFEDNLFSPYGCKRNPSSLTFSSNDMVHHLRGREERLYFLFSLPVQLVLLYLRCCFAPPPGRIFRIILVNFIDLSLHLVESLVNFHQNLVTFSQTKFLVNFSQF